MFFCFYSKTAINALLLANYSIKRQETRCSAKKKKKYIWS